MKRVFAIMLLVCLLGVGVQAQKTTTISATVDGYTGRVVDFEFIDNPDKNMQFLYKEKQKMEFDVEIEEPTLLKINAYVWLIVSPGDVIHTDIYYSGKNYKTAEFRGTSKAVLIAETIRDGRNHRVADHYKMNPLAAVVTLVPIEDYYSATIRNWGRERELLESIRSQVDPSVYNYIYSELEGTYMSNLVNYPFMSAGYGKDRIEDAIPDGYWSVLDKYKVRDDKASLKSYSYMAWLLDYKEYSDRRMIYRKGGTDFKYDRDLRDMYSGLVKFYKGKIRDAALYILLYNAITSQQDFDLIAELCKDYFKKYNKNQKFKEELIEMQR